MEKQLVIPTIPARITLSLFAVLIIELVIYGILIAVPLLWATLIFGAFYIGYMAFFRKDALPLIFAILFLTAHHSLLFHFNRELPIALLFLIIFGVNSAIMWLLLHYATHLKREYHVAYSVISGFMMAQIITIFASAARDWPFRFEVAAYMATIFSYIFWRFACIAADSVLGWKQFLKVAIVVAVLIVAIILGSPNVQV